MTDDRPPHKTTLVWDLPIRLWHWVFAAAVVTCLLTGLVDSLYYIEIHATAGTTIVALIVLRLLMAVFGGTYTRWRYYRISIREFIKHFKRQRTWEPHTAPGVILVLLLLTLAGAQSLSGLVMTDDIFFDGPLYRSVSDEVRDAGNWIHREAWIGVVALVLVHVITQLVYAFVLRDKLPLGMITGRKAASIPPTTVNWIAFAGCLCVAGYIWWVLFTL